MALVSGAGFATQGGGAVTMIGQGQPCRQRIGSRDGQAGVRIGVTGFDEQGRGVNRGDLEELGRIVDIFDVKRQLPG